jgi:hypothetical protein
MQTKREWISMASKEALIMARAMAPHINENLRLAGVAWTEDARRFYVERARSYSKLQAQYMEAALG